MKFEVGRIVEVVNNSGMAASLGATAIVKGANHDWYDHELIDVVWKTNFNNQMNGGYESHHFKPLYKKGEQLLFSFMRVM